MKRVLAVVLIVAGTMALAFRSFDYTKDKGEAKLGPVEISVKQKERVTIPVWAGILAVAAGAGLLLVDRRR